MSALNTIEFPASNGTDREVQLQPVIPQRADRNVLVLEDDPVQLQILTCHLQALNLNVVSATTIAEATGLVHRQPLHLAILDINLPDGSGLQLCEQIDGSPTLAGLPTIVLSSMSDVDVVRQTRAAGGCFFIGKPYDPNVLLAIIERALGMELQ
jgi:DNA-binding response OmpR family regulator